MSEEASRRKNKRHKVNWSARLLFPDRRIVGARARDISSGGVSFEYEHQILIGQKVSIELSPWLNGKQCAIRAKGVITYSMILCGNSGFNHGLKFTTIPKKQFNQLVEILKCLDQG